MSKSSIGTKPNQFKFGGDAGEIINVPPGYRARWVRDEDRNISRKLAEGWVFVSKSNSSSKITRKSNFDDNKVVEGAVKSKSSALKYREMIAMMLPIKDIHGDGQCVEGREAAIRQKTQDQYDAKIQGKDSKRELGRYADHFKTNMTIE